MTLRLALRLAETSAIAGCSRLPGRLWKCHYHRRPRAECGRNPDPRYCRDGQRERQAHGERRGHAWRNFSTTANNYAYWNSHTDCGGTALSGFANSNEMSTEGLVNGLLISQTLVNDATNFDLQLITTVTTPVPMPDPEFPTGCTVTPTSPLAAGGTLTCISATPITEAIATNIDGVTIIIGESTTQTTVMPASGDALSATIASTSAAGNITINSEFGTISGAANGIYTLNAGTGTTSITVDSVSASAGIGILTRTRAGANITVTAGSTVTGGGGMNAIQTEGGAADTAQH